MSLRLEIGHACACMKTDCTTCWHFWGRQCTRCGRTFIYDGSTNTGYYCGCAADDTDAWAPDVETEVYEFHDRVKRAMLLIPHLTKTEVPLDLGDIEGLLDILDDLQ